MRWEMADAAYGGEKHAILLREGWEPFAILDIANCETIIFFKRQVSVALGGRVSTI